MRRICGIYREKIFKLDLVCAFGMQWYKILMIIAFKTGTFLTNFVDFKIFLSFTTITVPFPSVSEPKTSRKSLK